MTQSLRTETAASIGGITADKPASPNKTWIMLVPMDLSPVDAELAGFALEIARNLPSSVLIVHAVHLNLSAYAPIPLSRLKADLCREALEKCTELMQHAACSGIAVTCVVEEGTPTEVITRVAARWNPDLVVMRGRKRGLLARFLGGATIDRVKRNLKCPVLTLEMNNKTETYA